MRKTRKQLKQIVKLYQSDNGALADEAIKYKELAERATVDCVRLVARLEEQRNRAEKAETDAVCLRYENNKLKYLGDRLIGVGNDLDFLAGHFETSKHWDALRIEWQNAKSSNG